MENNQQRSKHGDAQDNKTSSSSNNEQKAPQNVSNSETANKNRFAETTSGEQGSKSSKPDAENETLGTP